MKNRLLITGMLALALALGMTVAGCDNDSVTGGNNSGNNNGPTSGNDNGEDDYDEDVPLPLSSGVNAVSGKTCFEDSYTKIVFSTTADEDTSGTYIRSIIEDGSYPTASDKYSYVDIGIGTYSWNEEAKTVTLKPEGVSFSPGSGRSAGFNVDEEFTHIHEPYYIEQNYGPILDKTAVRSEVRAELSSYKEKIEEEVFIQWLLENFGLSSVADFENYSVNEMFSNKTYGYSFSTDGMALFLEKALPANKGVNELSGQTYTTLDNKTYVFTASGYTYLGHRPETGSYAYDSSRKKVWLREESTNGKNRIEYYAAITADGETRYADINAYRAAWTNTMIGWWISSYTYNSANKTLN